jgi:SAM-dependent methyltransferase
VTGFGKTWLALREPVDVRSRDQALLAGAIEAVRNTNRDGILDIGCGTGSTFRTLSPKIGGNCRWRLFDHDPQLLDEARRRHLGEAEFLCGDLNDLEALPLADVGLVTASALFDLCSERYILAFVEKISEVGACLYAALNYDGEMHWSTTHALDEAIMESFNAHQLSNKGFGLSLGPTAWQTLSECLRKRGYSVKTAASPWIMTAADAELQRLFLDGIIRAVHEYGLLDAAEVDDWAEFRTAMIDRRECSCRVGHQDILAIR